MLPQGNTLIGSRSYRDHDRYTNACASYGRGFTVTELHTLMRDGGALISVSLGDITVRKVVYDDGRFHVLVEEGRDRIALAGSEGRASITYGPETVVVVSGTKSAGVARSRELLTSAKVVSTFRHVVERMQRISRTSAGPVGVLLTAAFIADLSGDPGVISMIPAIRSSAGALPVTHDGEGKEDFRDRWVRHATRALDEPDPGGADECRREQPLVAALRALLTLEAVWYEVAATIREMPSRLTR